MSEEMWTAQTTRDRLAALYGPVDWSRRRGVIHVAAIHGSSHATIALGPEAPPSDTDRFCLGFARARADAILTSGSILRAEPDLVHRYAESESADEVWRTWRRTELGRNSQPRLMVMTESGDLPKDHPALRASGGWIWTTPEGRDRLGPPPGDFVYVVGREGERGTDAALAFTLGFEGIDCVAIETGPSATKPLYERDASGRGVDELLLSRFEGVLPAAAEGPAFIAEETLARHFGAQPASRLRQVESSGPWSFERWCRVASSSLGAV